MTGKRDRERENDKYKLFNIYSCINHGVFASTNGYAVGQSLHANQKLTTSPWKAGWQMSDISQITRNVSHQLVYPNNTLNKILIKIYLSSCAFLANALKPAITHSGESFPADIKSATLILSITQRV